MLDVALQLSLEGGSPGTVLQEPVEHHEFAAEVVDHSSAGLQVEEERTTAEEGLDVAVEPGDHPLDVLDLARLPPSPLDERSHGLPPFSGVTIIMRPVPSELGAIDQTTVSPARSSKWLAMPLGTVVRSE